jgi:hypothetical protein
MRVIKSIFAAAAPSVLLLVQMPLAIASDCHNLIHYLCADWGPNLDAPDPEKAEPIVYFIKKIDFSCDDPSQSESKGSAERLWFCKMNWDGSNKKEICELWAGQNPSVATEGAAPGDNMWLSVCPKARKAVFSVEMGSGVAWGLSMIDLDGKNFRKLPEPKWVTGDKRAYVHPSLSPDGKQVVFSAVQMDPDVTPLLQSRLGIMSIDTGEVRWITNGFEDDTPTWSPNGDWIAYTHYFQTAPGKVPRRLWLIKSDGSEAHPVIGHLQTKDLFAWYPSWSHDGNWIYALSGGSWFYIIDASQQKEVVHKSVRIDGRDIGVGRSQPAPRGLLGSGLSVWLVQAQPPLFEPQGILYLADSARVPVYHYGDLSTHLTRWGAP